MSWGNMCLYVLDYFLAMYSDFLETTGANHLLAIAPAEAPVRQFACHVIKQMKTVSSLFAKLW